MGYKGHFVGVFVLGISLAVGLPSLFSQSEKSEGSLEGVWAGSWRARKMGMGNPIKIEFKRRNGKLIGIAHVRGESYELESLKFSPAAKKLSFELPYSNPDLGKDVRYKAQVKWEGNTITGTWEHEQSEGTFKLTRLADTKREGSGPSPATQSISEPS
ncbi:hypothetical protein MYX84_16065 [Acidobacteria bacterium AH-259-O06]|nr:hypothetical protein [Acidobacteria bacterium AH-259-L09]MDA2931434.1 hypothetical protein [Acidobacteria bacterium AH-259-O06]